MNPKKSGLLIPLLLSTAALAQARQLDDYVVRQYSSGRFFGAGAAIGDYDGDGVKDFAFGAPGADLVDVYSGVHGGLLHRIPGGSGTRFGQMLAFGNFDSDPALELVVYARNLNRVLVYDWERLQQGLPGPVWFATSRARTPAESMLAVDLDADRRGQAEIYLGHPRDNNNTGALFQAVSASDVRLVSGGARDDRFCAAMTAIPLRAGGHDLMVTVPGQNQVQIRDSGLDNVLRRGPLHNGNTGSSTLVYHDGKVLVGGEDSNNYNGAWTVYGVNNWNVLYSGAGSALEGMGRSGGFSVDGRWMMVTGPGQNREGRVYLLDMLTGAFQLYLQGEPGWYLEVRGNAVELYPGAGPNVFQFTALSVSRGMLVSESQLPLRARKTSIDLQQQNANLPFVADFGSDYGGQQLFLFGSLSGWGPTRIGPLTLGIVPDFVTGLGTFPGSNTPLTLDAEGRASFQIDFPQVSVNPFTLYFAGVLVENGNITATTDYGIGVSFDG